MNTATAREGIVATAFPPASDAGCAAFAAGGTAIDAAMAAAWALTVCEPSGSGLGGQTTLLVRLATGRTVAVDGHSRAPAAVSRKRLRRADQRAGHRAMTVPTTPAVLGHVQRRYGALPLRRVLEPAIRLAEEGYAITRLQSRQLRWCRHALAATPAASGFLDGGRPYRRGDVFRQPALASALRRIAAHGSHDFYRGELARAIVRDVQRHGGLLDAGDLGEARPLVERDPISAPYRGREVLSIQPPGGGVELLFALRLLEHLDEGGANDPARWYRALADATYASFSERERDPAHPDTWTPALGGVLLSQERAEGLARTLAQRTPVAAGVDGEEPGETTHLCTADAAGNVVSLTQSIQSLFGAKVANADYGFLYNNYLSTCPRRRHRYRLASRCLARSNAAPTLVLDKGRPVFALGAAGSRRIISALLHVLSGTLDCGLELAEAIDAPRVHARLGGRVWLERPAATPEVCDALSARYHTIERRATRSYGMGAVQAVELRGDGTLFAAVDPRRDGAARGW